MATRSIAAVIVALTLTACGSGAATTEAGDPAVDEWVTIVASHHGDWRESVTDTDFFCADSDAVDTCAAAYQSGGEAAEALGKDLLAAQDGGEVPAEIATLVADTEAAAAGYSAAYEAWAAIGCATRSARTAALTRHSRCSRHRASSPDSSTRGSRTCRDDGPDARLAVLVAVTALLSATTTGCDGQASNSSSGDTRPRRPPRHRPRLGPCSASRTRPAGQLQLTCRVSGRCYRAGAADGQTISGWTDHHCSEGEIRDLHERLRSRPGSPLRSR